MKKEFKAWDTLQKKFIIPDFSYFSEKDEKNKSFELTSVELSNKDMAWGLNSNLILVQWTGLLDKNGKKIFEGDMIKLLGHKLNNNTDVDIEEVFYDDDAGGFYHTYLDRPAKKFWKYAEVIGNIYENPDLCE